MDYVLVTPNEGAEYILKAKNWMYDKTHVNMWTDSGGSSYSAVAEYLANQDGKTLYDTRVKAILITSKIRSKKDLKPGDTIMFATNIENWQDKNLFIKNIPKNTNVVFLEMTHLGYDNQHNQSLLEFSVLFGDTILKSGPLTWNEFLKDEPVLIQK